MAKIKYSALVSDMRNKLNGSVMSKNRYGSYVRNKVTPVNPQTSYQLNQRATLSNLSSAWRGLTQAQRDSWTEAAKNRPFTDIFGDSKILSGQAFFVSSNLNLVANGLSQIDSPGQPVDVPFVTANTFNAVLTGSAYTALQFDVEPATIPAGYSLVVYATPAYSAGVSFVKNRFRRLGVFVPDTGTVSILAAVTARFGVGNIGEKISVRIALVANATGQLGLPFQVDTVITAP